MTKDSGIMDPSPILWQGQLLPFHRRKVSDRNRGQASALWGQKPYRCNLHSPVNIVLLLLLLANLLLAPVEASLGDESPAFRSCLLVCQGDDASRFGSVLPHPIPSSSLCQKLEMSWKNTSIALRLLHWDCERDCQYQCMWAVENTRKGQLSERYEVWKYFGKWPFIRIFGMQEPMSVFLSFGNLVANEHCLWRLWTALGMKERHEKSTNAHFMKVLWLTHFILACNAWIWSSVFHSRDTRTTERLDYFSAGAVMVFDVYLSLTRVLPRIKILSERSMTTLRTISGLVLALIYIRHVYKMHYVKFDYGYHVGLCVLAGIAQSAAWVCWVLFSKEGKSHRGRSHLAVFIVCVNLAVLLEVFDFPPVANSLDAHAMWHLTTIPLVYLFYEFVKRDVLTNGKIK